MPTPSIKDIQKLQAKIRAKHKDYLKLQHKINKAKHNPNGLSDKLNMVKLLKEHDELLSLSTELNQHIKEYPYSVELIDKVVPLLTTVGETLKKEPVNKDRLTYTYPVDGYTARHKKRVLDSQVSEKNNDSRRTEEMAEKGTIFLKDIQQNTRQTAMAKNLTNMLDMYSDEKQLLRKCSQSKPHSRGFPLSRFNESKPTTEFNHTQIREISAALKEIKNAKKPMKDKGTIDYELVVSQVRGFLLKYKKGLSETNNLQKVLTDLLNEPGIKGIGDKVENEKDLAAFEQFKHPATSLHRSQKQTQLKLPNPAQPRRQRPAQSK